jgi:hypothetical protein
MKNHRIISYSCAAAAAILLVLPVGAQAGSSTLSGYGGPGEGNQAVLGSALVGGHGGGGSSGAGSGGQGSGAGAEGSGPGAAAVESSSSQDQSAQGADGPSSSSAQSGSGAGKARPNSRSKTSSGAHASPQGQPVAARSYYPAAEHVPAGGQGTVLGLTADDLLYVILALVILVLVGLFTRRLDDSASPARNRG